jgi:hypothetical protein
MNVMCGSPDPSAELDPAHLLVRRRGDFHVAADAETAQLAALF